MNIHETVTRKSGKDRKTVPVRYKEITEMGITLDAKKKNIWKHIAAQRIRERGREQHSSRLKGTAAGPATATAGAAAKLFAEALLKHG